MKTQNNKSNIKMNVNIYYHPCLPPELEKEGWRAVELEKDRCGNTLLRIPSQFVGYDCEYHHCYIPDAAGRAWTSPTMLVFGCLGSRVINLSYAEGGGCHLARFAMIRRNIGTRNMYVLGEELRKLENF